MTNYACVLLLCFSFACQSGRFQIEQQPDLGQVAALNFDDLCAVAEQSAQYLTRYTDDSFAVHAGKIIDPDLTLASVKRTLAFICQTVKADKAAQVPSRLQDPVFLHQHFHFYRWQPDKPSANAIASNSANDKKRALLRAIPADQILLTKYYTKRLRGSAKQTAQFTQALYQLPNDEQGMTLAEAELMRANLTRFHYTRQQVMAGALLRQKLAKPLVWLTEPDLHDVLLQGTGVLEVDGELRYYNVHRNNGIAYDYHLGKREQARYWYFAQVPSIMGYGKTLASKIPIKAQVTVAGNVAALGVGKLLLLSYQQQQQQISRLAVLADQGGAFDNNLFQLDLLAGSYFGWDDYYQANQQLPDYAKAWILLLK